MISDRNPGFGQKRLVLLRPALRGIKIKQGATMKSGNTTTVVYQLYAEARNGKSIPVGERLTSRPEAELLRETYLTYLGTGADA